MKDGRPPENQSAAANISNSHLTLELFPSDDDAPTACWPKPDVMQGRLLARLLRGDEVTAHDWLRDVRGMRLADAVWDLKQAGWLVRRVLLNVRTADRTAEGVRMARIARYWLDPVQRRRMTREPRAASFLREVDFFERGPA
jgi:hypothetical protein